jgi:hypothetical protein
VSTVLATGAAQLTSLALDDSGMVTVQKQVKPEDVGLYVRPASVVVEMSEEESAALSRLVQGLGSPSDVALLAQLAELNANAARPASATVSPEVQAERWKGDSVTLTAPATVATLSNVPPEPQDFPRPAPPK